MKACNLLILTVIFFGVTTAVISQSPYPVDQKNDKQENQLLYVFLFFIDQIYLKLHKK
jgi:hypothetical protein